jgi:cytochrome c biogenesis protein CcdA
LRKILVLYCLFLSLGSLFAEVIFDPPRLFLPVESSREFKADLSIKNPEKEDLIIDFMASREGWIIEPSEVALKGGESTVIRISGPLHQMDEAIVVLMLSDREDVPSLYTINPVQTILPEAIPAPDFDAFQPFVFFYSPGCEICEEFFSNDLPALEKESGLILQPEKLNVFEPGNYERMEALLTERSRMVKDFPILIAGSYLFSGEQEIRNDFPRLLRSRSESLPPEQGLLSLDVTGRLPDLSGLAVFLAGLLDGINPCAFTTLIFLISYLRLLGKKGRDILKIGGSFTLAVFVTYFLVGLGAFQFIRMADSFSLVSSVIKYILGGSLFLFAGLSLVDYRLIRQGRASQSILQLSAERKKKIHKVVRASTRSSLVILSSFGAGILISLYELGCTGQIYLPMLVYMVKQEKWTALFPLTLYNIAFILPLILVFFLFYKGSDSDRINELFQRNKSKIKLATAVLFFLMGIFIFLF